MNPTTGRDAQPDGLAESWLADRAHLIDLAFRMVGDIGDAEDVVQEAFARFARTPPGEIDEPRGWLTVVTSRLCLDLLRSARRRRERPQEDLVDAPAAPATPSAAVAPDPADRVTLDDEIHHALLVTLHQLTPPERVSFVLYEVFSLPYDVIAEIVGRTPSSCRQLARRARMRLAARPDPATTPSVDPANHRRVTDAFIAACATGDLTALLSVLHPDAWGRADLVSETPTRSVVNHGRERVAATLLRYWRSATLVSHPGPDGPVLLAFVERRLAGVIVLTVVDEVVTSLHVVADPTHVRGGH